MKLKNIVKSNIFKFTSVLGFNQALNFLLIFIYLKTIDSSVYGTIGLLQGYAALIGLLFMFGIRDGFYTLYYKVNKHVLYANVFAFFVFMVGVVAFISIYYKQEFIPIFSIQKEFYSIIFIYAVAQSLYSMLEVTMRLEHWDKLYIYISTIRAILVFIVKLYFVLHLESDVDFIKNILLTDVFSFVIISIILFVYINMKILKFKYKVDFSLYRRLFKVGIPFFASNGSGWIFNGFDRILIEKFFSIEILGIYMYGTRIAAAIGGIIHQVLNLLYGPKALKLLAEDKIEEMELVGYKIKNQLKTIILFSFILTFCLYLSLQYLDIAMYPVISLIFLGSFLVEISKIVPRINGQKLLHLEKSYIISGLLIGSSILVILLYYLFLPIVGIGAIFLLQVFIYFLISYLTHRYIRVKTEYDIVKISYRFWIFLMIVEMVLAICLSRLGVV